VGGHDDDRVAEFDAVTVVQRRRGGDARTVDRGAVGAAEVRDDEGVAVDVELEMAP